MKKGFTLIELLAVILILGIIALIAIPQVTNVIENANKGAKETSAKHYIDAVNNQVALNKLDQDSSNDISDGVINVEEHEVNISGQAPTSGIVYVENGHVKMADLYLDGYSILCNSKGKCKSEKGEFVYYSGTSSPSNSVSDKEKTRPTDKTAYVKYQVENNTLGVPQGCVYNGIDELCIKANDYTNSFDLAILYYGFDKNNMPGVSRIRDGKRYYEYTNQNDSSKVCRQFFDTDNTYLGATCEGENENTIVGVYYSPDKNIAVGDTKLRIQWVIHEDNTVEFFAS